MKTKSVELKIDELRENLNLFIATPMYGGNCMEPYFRSSLQLLTFFNKHQLKLAYGTIANESLISRARNILVSYFLNSKCSHLLFIDGDIEFKVEDVLKLYAHDKDIVVGAYPKKGLNWQKIRNNILKSVDKPLTDDQLAAFGADYAINFKFVDRETKSIAIENGLIKLHDASTGFMMIKREAILKMIENYPELKYVNDVNTRKVEINDNCYAFFDTFIDPVDRRYLSEDYGFTRLWQKIGGEIWIDPTINLNHFGHFKFAGNPVSIINMENFQQKQEPQQDTINIDSIDLSKSKKARRASKPKLVK